MGRPAVFLDRDGTVLKEKHYLKRATDVELEDGAAEGLALLRKAGYALVIISNQSGLARGFISHVDMEEANAAMALKLERAGVNLSGIFVCPHAPEDKCACRKPSPTLVHEAARKTGLNLKKSYFIGDKMEDVQTGVNAGVTPILVLTGYGKEASRRVPAGFVRAENLRAAAELIARRREEPR